MCVRAYVYVYVCVCACVYVCVYVYKQNEVIALRLKLEDETMPAPTCLHETNLLRKLIRYQSLKPSTDIKVSSKSLLIGLPWCPAIRGPIHSPLLVD